MTISGDERRAQRHYEAMRDPLLRERLYGKSDEPNNQNSGSSRLLNPDDVPKVSHLDKQLLILKREMMLLRR